jgi:hypothetical protein
MKILNKYYHKKGQLQEMSLMMEMKLMKAKKRDCQVTESDIPGVKVKAIASYLK